MRPGQLGPGWPRAAVAPVVVESKIHFFLSQIIKIFSMNISPLNWPKTILSKNRAHLIFCLTLERSI